MDDTAASAFLIMAGAYNELRRKRRKRPRWWIRSFLAKRPSEGAFNSLMRDLRVQSGFENFLRMTFHDFEFLLDLIVPEIEKNSNCRNPIPPGEMLATTLRFLATGDSYSSLMYLHRISKSTISRLLPVVCKAIVVALKSYIQLPQNENGWEDVSKGFYTKWNHPNCLGALDGKHVVIQAPANSGSLYYNYKGTFSIVLMALCDANYNFMYVDVGVQGRECDAGVFLDTDLYSAVEQNQLNFPQKRPLPGRDVDMPFVIVADDAFAMTERIMKPFTGRHNKGSIERAFNYRHSRARRVIENAFGIMSSVFRVLRKPISLQPESAKWVTLSCAYLHNFLRNNSSAETYSPAHAFDSEDEQGNVTNGTWRNDGIALQGLKWVKQRGKILVCLCAKKWPTFFTVSLSPGKIALLSSPSEFKLL